jgi:hypothetical protein
MPSIDDGQHTRVNLRLKYLSIHQLSEIARGRHEPLSSTCHARFPHGIRSEAKLEAACPPPDVPSFLCGNGFAITLALHCESRVPAVARVLHLIPSPPFSTLPTFTLPPVRRLLIVALPATLDFQKQCLVVAEPQATRRTTTPQRVDVL